MSRPILFVAREPDETLRTFLPIMDELARRGAPSQILFHHWPGEWARAALEQRGVPWWFVPLPVPKGLAVGPLGRVTGDLAQLRTVRRIARREIDRLSPAAVVVIQDTLLLERFLVRWANRRAIPTVVVQWAFNFPQEYYDRLRALRQAPSDTKPGQPKRRTVTASLYQLLLHLLDLRFDLANSYGGGEARTFAVMGEHFERQYRRQGVRGKRIVMTGHPTHDLAYRRILELTDAQRANIRHEYGVRDGEHMVLYATQPFFWRRVITPQQLRENVGAMNAAVARLGDTHRLTIKIHPRESPEDYAFCSELSPPVRVVAQAEMVDLIACADVFVSSSSSTVLLAMMLDRPIITVNFNQVLHFDFFESIGGTLHVRSHQDFAEALERAVGDSAVRAELARSRHETLGRLVRFDGLAAARISDLLVPGVRGAAA